MPSSDDRQPGSWQSPSWLCKAAKALPAQQAWPACHLQSYITALQVPQHQRSQAQAGSCSAAAWRATAPVCQNKGAAGRD